MRDVFYTILVVWILYRIVSGVNSVRSRQSAQSPSQSSKKTGETTVNYTPPKKKNPGDDEGEYVEFEEIK